MLHGTSSVFTRVGHKEDGVAKAMSEQISKKLNRITVVIAGIHWDKMKKKEIETVVGICNIITKKIIEEVSKR